MSVLLTRDDATQLALTDAEARGGAPATLASIEDQTFTNSALGASRPGEMSADMMTPGWQITVNAGGSPFVYRASARQVRHLGSDGTVLLIYPA